MRKRAERVITWCIPHLAQSEPQPIRAEELTLIFGNQTSNALSKWLRCTILERHGYEIGGPPTGSPLHYTINPRGIEMVLQLLNPD